MSDQNESPDQSPHEGFPPMPPVPPAPPFSPLPGQPGAAGQPPAGDGEFPPGPPAAGGAPEEAGTGYPPYASGRPPYEPTYVPPHQPGQPAYVAPQQQGQPPYGGQPPHPGQQHDGIPPLKQPKSGGNAILWIILSGVGVVILLIALVWWGVAAFLVGDDSASGDDAGATESVETEAPAVEDPADETADEDPADEAPEQEEPADGQAGTGPVTLGSVAVSGGPIVVDQGFGVGEVTLHRAAVTDDHGGILSEEDDIFLMLDLTWTTTEGDESSANRSYFHLVDANGDEMELDTSYLEDDRLVAERVANGDELRKTLSFVVTDSTVPFELTVESLTGAESAVISIG